MTASYANVREQVETAAVNAAWWDGRATSADRASARQAGSDAVRAIDAALRDLYRLREQLVSDLVRADKALLDQCDAFDSYRDNIKAGSL